MKLKCECCGYEEDLDLDEAYEQGWDEPTHVPSWPVSCPLCPGVCSMGLQDHSEAHARWEKEGRPEQFDFKGIKDNDLSKLEEALCMSILPRFRRHADNDIAGAFRAANRQYDKEQVLHAITSLRRKEIIGWK